jgi:hypothetical protein
VIATSNNTFGWAKTRRAYLLLRSNVSAHRLDTITALDNIGLQRDGPGAAVQLEEETAGIA